MNATPEQKILFAIIQSQDLDCCADALTEANLEVNRLPSIGGFLGKRNATVLFRVYEEKVELATRILQNTCKERIEYIVVPLETASIPLATPTPVTVGGATVFELDIDRYEEL